MMKKNRQFKRDTLARSKPGTCTKTIKIRLDPTGEGQLEFLRRFYHQATGREVSHTLILRRAIETLTIGLTPMAREGDTDKILREGRYVVNNLTT